MQKMHTLKNGTQCHFDPRRAPKRPKAIRTYKPLRGGRYHCNQTGEIIRYPKEHRWKSRALFARDLLKKPAATQPRMRTTTIDDSGDTNCPYCGRMHYDMRPGTTTCRSVMCNKEFKAESLPPAPEVAIYGRWVTCPNESCKNRIYTEKWQLGRLTKCSDCGQRMVRTNPVRTIEVSQAQGTVTCPDCNKQRRYYSSGTIECGNSTHCGRQLKIIVKQAVLKRARISVGWRNEAICPNCGNWVETGRVPGNKHCHHCGAQFTAYL